MSRPIYKPISLEDAAKLMEDKDAEVKLFVQDEDFALFSPFEGHFNIGWLSKQSWYIRCEQEDDFECRPEVSE